MEVRSVEPGPQLHAGHGARRSAPRGGRRRRADLESSVVCERRRVRAAPGEHMSAALPSRTELEAIATRAGRLALGHFRRVAPERKADRTLVTAADREVEAELVSALGALLPDAGIIGEEGAAREGR